MISVISRWKHFPAARAVSVLRCEKSTGALCAQSDR